MCRDSYFVSMDDNRSSHPYHAVQKHSLIMRYVHTSVRSVLLIYITAEALAPLGIMYTAVTTEPHPPVYPDIPCGTLKALAGNAGIDLKNTSRRASSGASGNTGCDKHRSTVNIVSKNLIIDAYIYIGKIG